MKLQEHEVVALIKSANPVAPNDSILDQSISAGVLLDAIETRRETMSDISVLETVQPTPEPPRQRRVLALAAAAIAVVAVGAAAVFLTTGDTDQANPPVTEVPPTTVVAPTTAPPVAVDISAANPIEADHDQSARATVRFAGDARALAEGGVYFFEMQLILEGGRTSAPDFTATYTNDDGVITTTASNVNGDDISARWNWFAEDGVEVTVLGQGMPDSRPDVIVKVQETASSTVTEFVFDTP